MSGRCNTTSSRMSASTTGSSAWRVYPPTASRVRWCSRGLQVRSLPHSDGQPDHTRGVRVMTDLRVRQESMGIMAARTPGHRPDGSSPCPALSFSRICMHSRRLLPGYALGLAALVYCGPAAANGLYPTQFFNTLNGPNVVVSADVNGDGHPDLVEIGTDNTVAVLLNRGNGSFRSPTSYYSVGTQPVALAVADLSHNGKM